MSCRVLVSITAAVALSLAGAGCSAGRDRPTRAGASSPGASETPSPASYGEPAYPDAAAAFAAIGDYNTRNNALIDVASRPPFPREAFAPVDTGPVLAHDRWQIALAEADPKARASKGWAFEEPRAVYLPAARTWPKLVLAAADARIEGAKPPKAGKWIDLAVFVQADQGAPLKHHASIPVLRGRLPGPIAPDADPAVPDRARAVALARALAEHWTKDTAAVPGFVSTSMLDADLARDRAQPPGPNAISWTARLLRGEAGVHTVAVDGGTLVVADYTIRKTIRALGLGSLVYWSGDYAKVLGAEKRRSVSATTYAGAVWLQPTGGGDAVPLGATRVEAIFR
ncbi:MAG TPA: hypothetical protein VF416_09860 [Marmoricola sp.]